jgi:hypothetical protein
MKKLNFLFILSIAALCSSCFGGLLSPDGVGGGSISCDINGKNWKAEEAAGVNVLGIVSITGTTGSGKNTSTLLLALEKEKIKTGATVDLSDEGFGLGSALTSYNTTVNGVEAFYAVTSGEIKISSSSGSKISGSFNFKAEDLSGVNKTLNVENGKFSVNVLL